MKQLLMRLSAGSCTFCVISALHFLSKLTSILTLLFFSASTCLLPAFNGSTAPPRHFNLPLAFPVSTISPSPLFSPDERTTMGASLEHTYPDGHFQQDIHFIGGYLLHEKPSVYKFSFVIIETGFHGYNYSKLVLMSSESLFQSPWQQCMDVCAYMHMW